MKTKSVLPDRDGPLRSIIEKDSIVIKIGKGTIAFCAEQADNLGFTELEVVNVDQFAKDVICAMNHESEDGSTLITRMLDKAIVGAIEDGSIAVRTEETYDDETDFGDDYDPDDNGGGFDVAGK